MLDNFAFLEGEIANVNGVREMDAIALNRFAILNISARTHFDLLAKHVGSKVPID